MGRHTHFARSTQGSTPEDLYHGWEARKAKRAEDLAREQAIREKQEDVRAHIGLRELAAARLCGAHERVECLAYAPPQKIDFMDDDDDMYTGDVRCRREAGRTVHVERVP